MQSQLLQPVKQSLTCCSWNMSFRNLSVKERSSDFFLEEMNSFTLLWKKRSFDCKSISSLHKDFFFPSSVEEQNCLVIKERNFSSIKNIKTLWKIQVRALCSM